MLWRHVRRRSLETREETCSRQTDRPAMEADGQTCYGGRWIDLLWRQMNRYAMETGGQTCFGDTWDDLLCHVVEPSDQ
jgi:hypothetical protein